MSTQIHAAPAPAPTGPPPTESFDEGHAYFQGAIVPLARANVSIATHAFNYGTGCFEGIRGYWNAAHAESYVLKLPEHFARLIRLGRILKIAPVAAVDGRVVGDGTPGPITRALQDAYFRTVRGEMPTFRHWLTPLYEGA